VPGVPRVGTPPATDVFRKAYLRGLADAVEVVINETVASSTLRIELVEKIRDLAAEAKGE
jgi:hypothetical protein